MVVDAEMQHCLHWNQHQSTPGLRSAKCKTWLLIPSTWSSSRWRQRKANCPSVSAYQDSTTPESLHPAAPWPQGQQKEPMKLEVRQGIRYVTVHASPPPPQCGNLPMWVNKEIVWQNSTGGKGKRWQSFCRCCMLWLMGFSLFNHQVFWFMQTFFFYLIILFLYERKCTILIRWLICNPDHLIFIFW